MKKLLVFALLTTVAVLSILEIKKTHDEKKAKENLAADYARIDTIITSLDALIHSPAVLEFGDARVIRQFRFRDIRDYKQGFFWELLNRVGTDFNGKLSNGDVIYMQINAITQAFWIYAGDTETENMIYPDWNYTRVPKR